MVETDVNIGKQTDGVTYYLKADMELCKDPLRCLGMLNSNQDLVYNTGYILQFCVNAVRTGMDANETKIFLNKLVVECCVVSALHCPGSCSDMGSCARGRGK